jgi:Ca2+-binding RTX toxin-like protein
MPVVISANDSVYTNDVTLTDAPAVWMTGDRIRFINSESGRVITSTAGIPAIRMDGADGVVINEAGGVIRSAISGGSPLVISGSAGADRVENGGTITGVVSLGGGSDTFISRVAPSGSATIIDLGTGDDMFCLRPSALITSVPIVDGGDGEDRFVIFESDGNVDGPLVSNFEILELRANGLADSFSGLDTILADYRAAGRNFSGLNFLDAPDAAILILADRDSAGLSILNRSAIGSLTGSAFADYVTIGNDTLVSGVIDLGGGDDTLSITYSQFEATRQLSIGTLIDGGFGMDALDVRLQGGDIFDAGNVVGFERVRVSVFAASPMPLIVRNADNVLNLIIGHGESAPVRVEDSDLSGGRIAFEPRTSLIIAAGTVVGSVASLIPFSVDTPVADDTESISILNEGQILGDVQMYIGDDIFDSRIGTVGGRVYGAAGNDTIQTDAGDNWLDGGAGADFLSAGVGADSLFGGPGNDTLIGGAGNDFMAGGTGSDLYIVGSAGDSIVEASGEGFDQAYTSTSYVLAAGVSLEVLSVDDYAATIAINLTGNEFGQQLIGNSGVNVLSGGGGTDALSGLDGNDTLIGGTGTDAMAGGSGNDVYIVDNAGDAIVEAAGQGFDQVYSSVSYTLGAGVEAEIVSVNDYAATAAINLTGNELVQVLYGNAGANVLNGDGGNDALSGLGGNDILIGGSGADTMAGGTGDDVYLVDDAGDSIVEAAGEGYDQVYSSVSYTLGAGVETEILSVDDYAAIIAINLTGNELVQVLYGNAGSNVLNGGGGNDALSGIGGNDILIGGSGADTMAGGTGDDVYIVDNAGDSVVEAAGGGFDQIYSSVSYALAAGVEAEVLSVGDYAATAAINLTGNELAQQLYGNAGANVLNGGGGADYLRGMGGADTFAFTTALGSGNVDAIGDFVSGSDRIALDHGIFGGVAGALPPGAFVAGTAAQDANDRIIYDSATGNLYFDADGNGAGAAMLFATLQAGLPLAADDFLVI